MKNKITVLGASAMLFVMPMIASAQSNTLATPVQNVGGLIDQFGSWVAKLPQIMLTLAIVGFFWGLAKYLFSEAENKDKGKTIMIWGLLAIFVMGSLSGIIALLQNTTGTTNNSDSIKVPCVGGCNKTTGSFSNQ